MMAGNTSPSDTGSTTFQCRPSGVPTPSAAKVPGTGSPSMARWARVREDEKPSAPASTASWTMRLIAAMSSTVAGSLRAPRSPMT